MTIMFSLACSPKEASYQPTPEVAAEVSAALAYVERHGCLPADWTYQALMNARKAHFQDYILPALLLPVGEPDQIALRSRVLGVRPNPADY
jgi:hypothetical protein